MQNGTKTILVVDDDLEIRDTLKDVLVEEGYAVKTAANGAEALELLRDAPLREHEPSLIVLDLMMPEMSGWQFCEAQRADPALSSIPVLIISAASLREGREGKGSIAGHPLLKKPIELDRLLEAVSTYAR
jgi:CheY-like chemotaxis protein